MHYQATGDNQLADPSGEPKADAEVGAKVPGRLAEAGLLFLLLAKFGQLLKASAILAKFAKIWVTVATMAASIVVYAFTFGGWWLAIGLVGMILIHEMGHVMAMRREGMETKAPVFIPLLGAVIFAPEMKDREQEARIGYAGPLIGGLAALVVFLIALTTSGDLRTGLLIASYLGAFINVFNLVIPIRPLDGGRVTQIVGDWFQYVGFAALAMFIVVTQARALLLIAILVLVEVRWPSRLKVSAAIALDFSLFVMVAFSLGLPQPAWADVLDLVLAMAFTALIVIEGKRGKDQPVENPDANTTSWPIRVKWLVLYLGLTAALVGLMLLHLPLLPSEITGN
jgi:Zn-dependent protease